MSRWLGVKLLNTFVILLDTLKLIKHAVTFCNEKKTKY